MASSDSCRHENKILDHSDSLKLKNKEKECEPVTASLNRIGIMESTENNTELDAMEIGVEKSLSKVMMTLEYDEAKNGLIGKQNFEEMIMDDDAKDRPELTTVLINGKNNGVKMDKELFNRLTNENEKGENKVDKDGKAFDISEYEREMEHFLREKEKLDLTFFKEEEVENNPDVTDSKPTLYKKVTDPNLLDAVDLKTDSTTSIYELETIFEKPSVICVIEPEEENAKETEDNKNNSIEASFAIEVRSSFLTTNETAFETKENLTEDSQKMVKDSDEECDEDQLIKAYLRPSFLLHRDSIAVFKLKDDNSINLLSKKKEKSMKILPKLDGKQENLAQNDQKRDTVCESISESVPTSLVKNVSKNIPEASSHNIKKQKNVDISGSLNDLSDSNCKFCSPIRPFRKKRRCPSVPTMSTFNQLENNNGDNNHPIAPRRKRRLGKPDNGNNNFDLLMTSKNCSYSLSDIHDLAPEDVEFLSLKKQIDSESESSLPELVLHSAFRKSKISVPADVTWSTPEITDIVTEGGVITIKNMQHRASICILEASLPSLQHQRNHEQFVPEKTPTAARKRSHTFTSGDRYMHEVRDRAKIKKSNTNTVSRLIRRTFSMKNLKTPDNPPCMPNLFKRYKERKKNVKRSKSHNLSTIQEDCSSNNEKSIHSFASIFMQDADFGEDENGQTYLERCTANFEPYLSSSVLFPDLPDMKRSSSNIELSADPPLVYHQFPLKRRCMKRSNSLFQMKPHIKLLSNGSAYSLNAEAIKKAHELLNQKLAHKPNGPVPPERSRSKLSLISVGSDNEVNLYDQNAKNISPFIEEGILKNEGNGMELVGTFEIDEPLDVINEIKQCSYKKENKFLKNAFDDGLEASQSTESFSTIFSSNKSFDPVEDIVVPALFEENKSTKVSASILDTLVSDQLDMTSEDLNKIADEHKQFERKRIDSIKQHSEVLKEITEKIHGIQELTDLHHEVLMNNAVKQFTGEAENPETDTVEKGENKMKTKKDKSDDMTSFDSPSFVESLQMSVEASVLKVEKSTPQLNYNINIKNKGTLGAKSPGVTSRDLNEIAEEHRKKQITEKIHGIQEHTDLHHEVLMNNAVKQFTGEAENSETDTAGKGENKRKTKKDKSDDMTSFDSPSFVESLQMSVEESVLKVKKNTPQLNYNINIKNEGTLDAKSSGVTSRDLNEIAEEHRKLERKRIDSIKHHSEVLNEITEKIHGIQEYNRLHHDVLMNNFVRRFSFDFENAGMGNFSNTEAKIDGEMEAKKAISEFLKTLESPTILESLDKSADEPFFQAEESEPQIDCSAGHLEDLHKQLVPMDEKLNNCCEEETGKVFTFPFRSDAHNCSKSFMVDGEKLARECIEGTINVKLQKLTDMYTKDILHQTRKLSGDYERCSSPYVSTHDILNPDKQMNFLNAKSDTDDEICRNETTSNLIDCNLTSDEAARKTFKNLEDPNILNKENESLSNAKSNFFRTTKTPKDIYGVNNKENNICDISDNRDQVTKSSGNNNENNVSEHPEMSQSDGSPKEEVLKQIINKNSLLFQTLYSTSMSQLQKSNVYHFPYQPNAENVVPQFLYTCDQILALSKTKPESPTTSISPLHSPIIAIRHSSDEHGTKVVEVESPISMRKYFVTAVKDEDTPPGSPSFYSPKTPLDIKNILKIKKDAAEENLQSVDCVDSSIKRKEKCETVLSNQSVCPGSNTSFPSEFKTPINNDIEAIFENKSLKVIDDVRNIQVDSEVLNKQECQKLKIKNKSNLKVKIPNSSQIATDVEMGEEMKTNLHVAKNLNYESGIISDPSIKVKIENVINEIDLSLGVEPENMDFSENGANSIGECKNVLNIKSELENDFIEINSTKNQMEKTDVKGNGSLSPEIQYQDPNLENVEGKQEKFHSEILNEQVSQVMPLGTLNLNSNSLSKITKENLYKKSKKKRTQPKTKHEILFDSIIKPENYDKFIRDCQTESKLEYGSDKAHVSKINSTNSYQNDTNSEGKTQTENANDTQMTKNENSQNLSVKRSEFFFKLINENSNDNEVDSMPKPETESCHQMSNIHNSVLNISDNKQLSHEYTDKLEMVSNTLLKTDTHNELTTDCNAELKIGTHKQLTTDCNAELKTDTHKQLTTDCNTNLKTNFFNQSTTECNTELKTDSHNQLKTDSDTEQKIDSYSRLTIDGNTDLKTDSINNQLKTHCNSELKTDSINNQLKTHCNSELKTDSHNQSTTDCIAELKSNTFNNQLKTDCTELKMNSHNKLKTDSDTEQKTGSYNGLITDGKAELKTNSQDQLKTYLNEKQEIDSSNALETNCKTQLKSCYDMELEPNCKNQTVTNDTKLKSYNKSQLKTVCNTELESVFTNTLDIDYKKPLGTSYTIQFEKFSNTHLESNSSRLSEEYDGVIETGRIYKFELKSINMVKNQNLKHHDHCDDDMENGKGNLKSFSPVNGNVEKLNYIAVKADEVNPVDLNFEGNNDTDSTSEKVELVLKEINCVNEVMESYNHIKECCSMQCNCNADDESIKILAVHEKNRPVTSPPVTVRTWEERQVGERQEKGPIRSTVIIPKWVQNGLCLTPEMFQPKDTSLGHPHIEPYKEEFERVSRAQKETSIGPSKKEEDQIPQQDRCVEVYPETLRQRQRNMAPSPSKVDIKNWENNSGGSDDDSKGGKKFLPSVKALRSQFENGKTSNRDVSPSPPPSISPPIRENLNNLGRTSSNSSTSSLVMSSLEASSGFSSLASSQATSELLSKSLDDEPVEPIFNQFHSVSDGSNESMCQAPSTIGWDPQPLLKKLYYIPEAPKMHSQGTNYINIDGYLEKLPSGRKKATFWNAWKRRYFVAKDGTLYYYQNNQTEKPNMKLPLMGGKVEIMDQNMVNIDDGDKTSRSASMLGIDDGKGHYVVVRCPTRQEAERWKKALDTHTVDDFSSQYVQPWPRPTNPTLLRDTLIIDIGSCSVRAGVLASQPTLPQLFFPSVVATNRETRNQIWGIDALMPQLRTNSSVTFPIRPSHKISKFSVDLNSISSLLQKTFKDLKVDPKNYNIQLSVPRVLNQITQVELLKILFDKFGVKAVNLTHQSILALYAYNATSGIVVDIGERIDVVPVTDGYIVDGGVSRIPYGGYRILDHIRQFLFQRNLSLVNEVDSYIIRQSLETVCYSAQHYNTEKQRCTLNTENFEKEVPLEEFFPNTPQYETFRNISLDFGRFQATEGLFNPDAWGLDHPGLQKLVHKAIQECSMDIRKEMSRCIFLSGGLSQLPGISERLTVELDNLTPPAIHPKVHSSPYRYHAAYIGACVLAESPAFVQSKITKEEWQKQGNSALRKWAL